MSHAAARAPRRLRRLFRNSLLAACALSVAGFLVLAASAPAAPAQAQRPQPPEYKEIAAAVQIQDPEARLKELERIKTAYPQSAYMGAIDQNILMARVDRCKTLNELLDLQKGLLKQGQGFRRFNGYYGAAMQIITHRNVKAFDKARVVKAVQAYKDDAAKLLRDEDFLSSIPQDQRPYLGQVKNGFDVVLAMAYVSAGDGKKALMALNDYTNAGGVMDPLFSYTFAEAAMLLDKPQEAYAGYLAAAVDSYGDAKDKAKALYAKLHGGADGFEAELAAKMRQLPYRVEAVKPPAGWAGKVVLAELFTGSECPPCVAADLGFDGLLEAFGPSLVAVLEYHLPIPRPDPMMNPATKKRQDLYGVESTPTTFFDGEARLGGGGIRSMAEGKFKAYAAEVTGRLAAKPLVVPKAAASRAGDVVKVDLSIDKAVPGAAYHVALVQKEEMYRGGNGIAFHKMVVRDLQTLEPFRKQAAFNLAASEKAAADYLADFEKDNQFKFAEKRQAIDRAKLAVVFFVQDAKTRKVLNAIVADVK